MSTKTATIKIVIYRCGKCGHAHAGHVCVCEWCGFNGEIKGRNIEHE